MPIRTPAVSSARFRMCVSCQGRLKPAPTWRACSARPALFPDDGYGAQQARLWRFCRSAAAAGHRTQDAPIWRRLIAEDPVGPFVRDLDHDLIAPAVQRARDVDAIRGLPQQTERLSIDRDVGHI